MSATAAALTEKEYEAKYGKQPSSTDKDAK
jgi:hypothetical protein